VVKIKVIKVKVSHQDRAAQWVSRNRGKLSEIAGQVNPKVSPQFVHLVLRGKRKSGDGRVEKLLRRAGAPV
jgi:hypothetical protein